MRYTIDKVLGEGVAVVGGQLWHRCKARKTTECQLSRRSIRPGDLVYRPMGNPQNRMHRIRAEFVDRAHPMTYDKALEAALLPCPFCGGMDIQPSSSMSRTHVWCRQCNSQGPSVWHGGPTDDRATLNRCEAEAIAAWNRRAPVSALPGEAEVVMEQIAHKEQIGIWANELTSALSLSDFLREDWSFDDSVDLENEVAAQLLDIIRSAITHPGMNLVASLQAMQARAEAAERELETQFNQHVDDLAKARGESEADKQSIVDLTDRVKEMEEALKPFAAITEIPALGCVTKDMVITARTALTGGSNG